jgi:hypothetical protein
MSIDTVLGLTGTILGMIGLFTGYVFYRRSRRVKEPFYSINSNNLIQDNVSSMTGLEVSYKGYPIESLTVTKILFWNNGADTIEKSDIVSANPLRIECSNGNRILDASVLETNNSSCQLVTEIMNAGRAASIDFDYLDKSNAAVIQIIHTGKTSANLTLKGDLKGATIRLYELKKLSTVAECVIAVMLSAILLILYHLMPATSVTIRIGLLVLGMVALFTFFRMVKHWAKKAYPPKFKDFGEPHRSV